VVSPSTSRPVVPEVPSERAVLAQAGAENFPVAARYLPRSVRGDLIAIYGFARLTDDIGDEAVGDRLALLDWLEQELDRAAVGTATHPVLERVGGTIRRRALPLEPFRALIAANRQDQVVTRYETYDSLVQYCMLSAAPVGQLVLGVLDAATPERVGWSDEVCVALQLVEHLQDVGEDARNGRVYLPAEDLQRAGCPESDLAADSASPALRQTVAALSTRARTLLASGSPLCRTLPLRLRAAVGAFAAGGLAALDEIERHSFDVLAVHCRPRRSRLLRRWVATAGPSRGKVGG
jgi:squalene synthase HpnC